MRGRLRRIVVGGGLAVLLLLVHVGAWRPARNALIQSVAYPLVAAIDTERAARFEVAVGPSGRSLEAVPLAGEGRGGSYHAPAGMVYLLPALVLIAAFPRRRTWLVLWLIHLALGAVAFGGFVAGVGWTGAGFALAFLVRTYAAPAASLLALVAGFAPGWQARLRDEVLAGTASAD